MAMSLHTRFPFFALNRIISVDRMESGVGGITWMVTVVVMLGR